jgi:hypothetical protein
LVGDEGGLATGGRAEVSIVGAGSFTGLVERVEGFELGETLKDAVRSSPLALGVRWCPAVGRFMGGF